MTYPQKQDYITQLLSDYFIFFQTKNISKLEKMFSDSVALIDWNIEAFGKNNVLEAIREIFEVGDKIEITQMGGVVDPSGVTFSEILIKIGEEVIKVVDVITFDDDFNISLIRAYKG